MMFWNADRTTVSREVFLSRLTEVMARDEWIIDGDYSSTMELRMAACDTVFFLDMPAEVCLDGVRKRRGTYRPDMPWIETEEDIEFMEFITKYNEAQRPRVMELLEKYSDKDIFVLSSREEADKLLAEFNGLR